MSLVCLRDVTRTVTLPDGEDLHILRGVNLDVGRARVDRGPIGHGQIHDAQHHRPAGYAHIGQL